MAREFEIEVLQIVTVTLDETKFDEAFMEEFRASFYGFTTIEEHAEHVAQLIARGIHSDGRSTEFIEGYGPANEMGIQGEITCFETQVVGNRYSPMAWEPHQ